MYTNEIILLNLKKMETNWKKFEKNWKKIGKKIGNKIFLELQKHWCKNCLFLTWA